MRKLSDIYSDTRGALFAGVAAIGLSALPAHAQDAESPPRHELLMRDARDVSREAAQSAAIIASSNMRQSLLFFGPNEETFRELVEGAQEALTLNDNTLRWVIISQGEPELAFYTDGVLTATILAPTGSDLNEIIVERLAQDLAKVRDIMELHPELQPAPEN